MAVGRPIKLTPNVARKNISVTATDNQTSFTITGGYRINELAVYRNGVRLVQDKDFTAYDGSTVTLQSGCATDDIVEFAVFDTFNIADAINANGNQRIGGDLVVGGGTTIYSSGIVSTNTLTAQTIGDSNSTLYGDGENLTGVISGVELKLNGTSVGTAATVLNFGAGISSVTPVSSGISTIETSRTLTIGVRSGVAVTFSISGGSFNVPNRAGGNTSIDV
tara:strand:+ start:186 stop:848 length:663 start_codon:yes stop_codon:yes gene_type:complete